MKKLRLRRPRIGVVILLAVAVAGVALQRRGRTRSDSARPADVGFMRAMHDALRRDMDRLESMVAARDGASALRARRQIVPLSFRVRSMEIQSSDLMERTIASTLGIF